MIVIIARIEVQLHVCVNLGRVLNRFSKDVEFLDERLVIIFLEYLIVSFLVIPDGIAMFIYLGSHSFLCCNAHSRHS